MNASLFSGQMYREDGTSIADWDKSRLGQSTLRSCALCGCDFQKTKSKSYLLFTPWMRSGSIMYLFPGDGENACKYNQ